MPKELKESNPSHLQTLKDLMEKMRVNQIAVIPKEEWKIKTKPWKEYCTYCVDKRKKYTFSGRQDKDNYYLMKVKFPISVEGERMARVWGNV